MKESQDERNERLRPLAVSRVRVGKVAREERLLRPGTQGDRGAGKEEGKERPHMGVEEKCPPEHQENTRVDGMADEAVGPRLDELMPLLERRHRAPVARQVHARPEGK